MQIKGGQNTVSTIVLRPQQVEERLRVLELFNDIGFSLIHILSKANHLSRQDSIDLHQLFSPLGSTVELFHLLRQSSDFSFEGAYPFLVLLQLVYLLIQMAPQALDDCLLGSTPNLECSHPHRSPIKTDDQCICTTQRSENCNLK